MGKGSRRFALGTIGVLIVSMLLGVMPLQPHLTEAQSGIPVGSIVQVTTATNVRSGPCTTYSILYTATTGTQFSVLDAGVVCGGYTFIHVRRISDGNTAYLAAELVAVVATPTPSLTPTRTPTAPTRTATRTATRTVTRTPTPLGGWKAGDLAQTTAAVNFRTGPGTNFSIISTLPTGAQLLVIGHAQSGTGGVFVPVRYNGTDGWVSADWIAKTGTATSTPTRTPTRTPTVTRTATSTRTATPSNTPTQTLTPSNTATSTQTLTPSNTPTPTQTLTPSNTPTSSKTPTKTLTPTRTSTPPHGFGPGDIVEVQQSLNFRTQPGGGSVIQVLPVGSRLIVTGTGLTVGSYFYIPVNFNGTNGWVASEYVDKIGVVTSTPTRTPSRTPTITQTPTKTLTPTPTFTPTTTRTATVTTTPQGGFGAGDLVRVDQSLYLRPSAGNTGAPIATLPTGATLLVTGTGQAANGLFWIPITYNSLTGWVASEYVTKIGVATSTPTASSTPTSTRTPSATATRTPTTTSTPTPIGGFADGDIVRTTASVNLRNFPSLSGTVVQVVPSGTDLVVTGPSGVADGLVWIPVRLGSTTGWIASNYVEIIGQVTTTPTATSTPNLSATATLTPTSSLTPTKTLVPSLTPTPTAGPGGFLPGDTVHTNVGVNMRSGAGTSQPVVRILDEGTQLTVTGYGKPASGLFWVPVITSDNVEGWVADNYLTAGVSPAIEPSETAVPTDTPVIEAPTEIPTDEPTVEIPPTEEPTLEAPPTEVPTDTPAEESSPES